jgi:hypothetical protein
MNSSELVKGVQYRLHSYGGCAEMETTVFRRFYGINNDGNALFYDESMECPVIYESYWTFHRI